MRIKPHIPIENITDSDIRRFKSGYVVDANGCWNWTKFKIGRGYGVMSFRNRNVRAHRFAYVSTYGPIPQNHIVCHRCDNPSCVNPDHLFCGTFLDNTLDMIAKGRHNYSRFANSNTPRGHCVRCGHHRTDDYVDRHGVTRCRNCIKIRDDRRTRLGLRRKKS